MTVTANTTRNDYTAGSAQSQYDYTFQLNEAADVDVYLDGVKQTLNTHYTVQNVGNASGGKIVFTLVDENGASIDPPEDAVINIVMAMDLDRDTNYQPSGAFLAADVNNDFDRLWLATNQQQTAVNRSLRLQDDDVTTSSMELPLKDARKGKLLAFNATTGDPEATSNNQSNWDTAYNNSITSASFSGSTLTLGQQDGGTITASHTPYLPIAGGTLTGDLNLGFNDLTVGNLTIENAPANATQIVETGTGNFIIKATNLFLQDANDEKYIDCTSNGDVKLYHNNSQKLATTASGISVTGTLSATGYNSGNWDTAYGWGDHSTAGYLTSYTETDPVFSAHVASGITSTNITNWNDAYNNKITAVNYSGSTLTLTQQDGGTLTTTIAGGGGASQWTTSGSNIYYNTGNVGIGTTSPATTLTVGGSSANGIELDRNGSDATASCRLFFDSSTSGTALYNHQGNQIFTTGATAGSSSGTERMRIDSSGNLGIGTTSPTVKLDVETQATGNVASFTGAHPSRNLLITNYTSGGDGSSYAINANSGYGQIKLQTVSNDRIKIDNNGDISFYEDTGTTPKLLWDASTERLALGHTSPTNDLHIKSTINSPILIETTHAGGNSRIEFRNENYRKNFGVNADGKFSLYDITNAKTPFSIANNSENNTLVISGSNVGIGTSSPAQPLHVYHATDNQVATFESGDSTSALKIKDNTDEILVQNIGGIQQFVSNNTSSGTDGTRFFHGSNEKMRINSSGNVGIGTTNPTSKLTLTGTGGNTSGIAFKSSNEEVKAYFTNDNADSDFSITYVGSSSAEIKLKHDGNVILCESAGNVGIGTTSPATTLTVGGSYANGIELDRNGADVTSSARLFFDSSSGGTAIYNYQGNTVFTANATSGSSSGDERMRLTSTGNVGIGTSSPQAIFHTSTSVSEVARFENTGTLPAYVTIKNNGTTGITGFGSVDNDLALYANTVEQMRINSAGNVGIGTTSPSQKLHVNGTARATTVLSGDGTASAPAIAFSNDTDTGIFRPFPDTLAFSEGGVERMRINSAGNVGVGTTSISAKLHVNGNILATSNLSCGAGGVISSAGFMNSPAFAIKSWTSTSTTFYPMLDFRTSGNTIVGSIKSNNTSTQYNTSSDERLKENIRNAEDAGAKIDAIQIRQFDWKEGGEHQDYGVIAQELKEVAPEAVSEGYTEDDMWSVDYSKLVPTLIKEIQSLRNRVAELENN